MKRNRTYTRRRFLRTITAGGIALAGGVHGLSGCATNSSRERAVRLVFYTDVHARTEWDTPLALQQAARAINAQKPDFTIAGGDLITDGFQSSAVTVAPRWDTYMAMHRAIDGDIYPAIGNHDLVAAIPEDGTPPSSDPRAIFRERLGLDRTSYSFNALGYHFIVLDSIQVIGGNLKYRGLISPEEMEWLREDLSGVSRDTPIVVALHIPLLTAFYMATESSTFAAQPNRVVVNNTDVLNLFGNHNLRLVLQGHLHAKESVQWRDTTFITGGAISARWWRGPWHGTEEGFCVVTLRGDNVEWEYIDYGWEARRPKSR